MTEKQKARWTVMRARGWVWFVFVWGVLRYGLVWGAFMLLGRYLRVFGGAWRGFEAELPPLLVVGAIFGISAAWFEWRREERRFQEAVNARGTPTV